jgi:hypothetical protein
MKSHSLYSRYGYSEHAEAGGETVIDSTTESILTLCRVTSLFSWWVGVIRTIKHQKVLLESQDLMSPIPALFRRIEKGQISQEENVTNNKMKPESQRPSGLFAD